MSEWITDRLPTEEDAVNWANMVWVTWEDGTVGTRHWSSVAKGQPWKLLTVPDPYVEPKRWTVKWDDEWAEWILLDGSEQFSYYLPMLCYEQADAAQRIADAYNEVMP